VVTGDCAVAVPPSVRLYRDFFVIAAAGFPFAARVEA